ncbi:arginine deiminase family protein [Prevotella sp. AGR2160]|uniref:arginine deiminase family protein n=1 Tax=Prevotella sp. AGR2160 TaxID=1280674 RepID=UPI0018C972B4|nr:arginine deiminase family protein [Prevotella sp. AGR2160]
MELFDGIIHPSAGLFERYFDEDTAGREHRHYIELLREKGIKVMTVREIMAVGGQSDHLAEDFRKAGVHVSWVPLENLIGGYGAAHCMTQVLERGL